MALPETSGSRSRVIVMLTPVSPTFTVRVNTPSFGSNFPVLRQEEAVVKIYNDISLVSIQKVGGFVNIPFSVVKLSDISYISIYHIYIYIYIYLFNCFSLFQVLIGQKSITWHKVFSATTGDDVSRSLFDWADRSLFTRARPIDSVLQV